MSYRPTISVFVGGEIADHGYYRNWSDKSLFYEAVAFAALFHNCKTKEEYRERAFRTQKVNYILEPESFENTQKNLLRLLEYSEFPIIVDLTLQNIYVSYGAVSPEELSLFHTFDLPYSFEEYVRLRQFRYRNNPFCEYIRNKTEKELRSSYASLLSESKPAGTRMNFGTLLDNYRIPFDSLDMEQLRSMYSSEVTLKRYCSDMICRLLDAA